jgi:hypothetical protein
MENFSERSNKNINKITNEDVAEKKPVKKIHLESMNLIKMNEVFELLKQNKITRKSKQKIKINPIISKRGKEKIINTSCSESDGVEIIQPRVASEIDSPISAYHFICFIFSLYIFTQIFEILLDFTRKTNPLILRDHKYKFNH